LDGSFPDTFVELGDTGPIVREVKSDCLLEVDVNIPQRMTVFLVGWTIERAKSLDMVTAVKQLCTGFATDRSPNRSRGRPGGGTGERRTLSSKGAGTSDDLW